MLPNTCLQVELKFFHEHEAQGVDFLCFLRRKRAREPERWGQLPEPEKRSEGLWESLMMPLPIIDVLIDPFHFFLIIPLSRKSDECQFSPKIINT